MSITTFISNLKYFSNAVEFYTTVVEHLERLCDTFR